MKLVGIVLLSVLISGCAGSKMTPTKTVYMSDGSTVVEQDPLIAVEIENRRGYAECQKARAAEAARAQAPVTCPPSMSELACVMLMSQAQNAAMMAQTRMLIAEISGKDPCASGQKGLFDYKIREVEEMNATARSIGGNFIDAFKMGALAWLGGKAFDAAGDEVNQNVGGDGSPSNSGRVSSEETAVGGIGDESPASTGGSGATVPVVDPATPEIPGITVIDTVDSAD